jgi:hypothetical protein
MGLNITHDCFNGPYSTFNLFRHSLGIQIGINLDEYKGYNKNGTKDLSKIEHELMPLLNHSDCNGRLTIKESKSIVKGLNRVLENFVENDNYDVMFKEMIIKFRDGCLDAISKRKMVKFQ